MNQITFIEIIIFITAFAIQFHQPIMEKYYSWKLRNKRFIRIGYTLFEEKDVKFNKDGTATIIATNPETEITFGSQKEKEQ